MTKVIGLTGGIASGKSTVTNYLIKRGYTVIDADKEVRQLQAKGGSLYQALYDWLGDAILLPSGDLNRKVLSQLIFSDSAYQQRSQKLQDDIIRQHLKASLQDSSKNQALLFMDIPLLFERSYTDWFDAIWLVYTDEKKQLERLMKRDGYSLEEAKDRLSSQWSLASKKDWSNLVIDNSGEITATYHQLEQALLQVEEEKACE